jgi:hypothetical protein
MGGFDGKLGEIRVKVSVGLIATLILVALTVAFYALTRSYSQTALFLAADAAAIGAILGAFYSSRALALTAHALDRERERQCKALAFVLTSRWNDPNLFHVRDTVRALFDVEPRSEGFNEVLTKNKTNVIHFLNMLEEIGVAMEHGGADEEILKSAYRGVVITAWARFGDFVAAQRRTRGRDDIWKKFEDLAIKWR